MPLCQSEREREREETQSYSSQSVRPIVVDTSARSGVGSVDSFLSLLCHFNQEKQKAVLMEEEGREQLAKFEVSFFGGRGGSHEQTSTRQTNVVG